MERRKEYEMLFQLNAQLGGSFNSTFKSGQSAIVSMQKEIEALSKTQSDISAYQKQQSAVDATQKKLEVLQQQYINIQKELEETGSSSSALKNQLLAKQQQIDKTSSSLEQQTQKLHRMGNALNDAGVDTSNLTNESAKLGEKINDVKKKQEEAADKANNFGTVASAAFDAVGQAIVAAGVVKALKEIADYFMECVDASMDFESAMTGVAKTTDMTDAELAAMAAEIKQLSTDIPVLTSELAGVAEVAGQLGIAKDDLLDFSTVMSMLSTATMMAADEAATLLAQFANITQMDPSYYANLASAIVDLGNNYATTEQKITEMSQGIAASASLAGMSEADMVALSAAVTSLGIETQAGSTSMSKLISQLMTAVETGDDLVDFASIANMTAAEFTRAWGDDAVTALQSFVVGLSDVERNGMSATVALTELGITETRMQRMILSLANSGELLNNTLETSNKAWAENTALTAEAEKRYGTTESQLTMMKNAYGNVRIAIGDALTPTLQSLYTAATKVLNAIAGFIERNPALVKGFTVFVGILGTAVAALVVYSATVKIAAAATALFAGAIPGVNVIMWTVTAVSALAGIMTTLASASAKVTVEYESWTLASKRQHDEIQALNEEYQRMVDVYGETYYEVWALQREIDTLTDAFENSKRTTESLNQEIEALNAKVAESADAYRASSQEISKEYEGSDALIAKLSQLAGQTAITAAGQKVMTAIADELNSRYSNLGLAVDNTTGKLNLTAEAIRDVAKAEAEQKQWQTDYDAYVEVLQAVTAQEKLRTEVKESATIAEREYQDALAAYAAKDASRSTAGWLSQIINLHRNEGTALDEAEAAYQTYIPLVDEAEAGLADLEAQQLALMEALGITEDALEENSDDYAELEQAISKTKAQTEELTVAYNEAYEAAYSSVSGQYALWDEAAKVSETSADKINSALESQISYWQDYNANISSLSERTGDIEGLSDVIASFADGSSDSVNAIAGMASATDKELAAMVTKWKELQQEEKAVSDSLAGIVTDTEKKTAEIVALFEDAAKDINLSEEAAASAQNTIQGFIDEAEDMLPEVAATYERIAQAAMNALALEGASVSIRGEWRGDRTYDIDGAHASGLAYVPFDGYIAELHRGERVLTADEAEHYTYAPQFIEALSALPVKANALSAERGSYNSGSVNVTFAPVYNLEGISDPNQVGAILASHDDGLKEYILDVLAEAGIDASRRRY